MDEDQLAEQRRAAGARDVDIAIGCAFALAIVVAVVLIVYLWSA